MKNILIILLFVAAFINAKSQQTYKPSRHAGPQNKPSGISSATPLDSRSYFYDSTTFTYRPYASRAEILSYLNLAAYRSGQFPIIMDSSGVRYELWFRNGTTNSDLVLKYPQTLTVDSSVYATKYYVDTGKTAIRTEITTKLDKTLASGKIFVGNGSNIATAVTPSGDVSATVGGSFTIQPNVVSYSKIQTNPAGTLIGNPSVSTGNNKAIYGKYGLLFDADSLKVDTAILKSVFAATSTGVDTIYRTPGVDSIYYTKNSFTYAIKDSIGGGSGTDSADVAGFGIIINRTANVRTHEVDTGKITTNNNFYDTTTRISNQINAKIIKVPNLDSTKYSSGAGAIVIGDTLYIFSEERDGLDFSNCRIVFRKYYKGHFTTPGFVTPSSHTEQAVPNPIYLGGDSMMLVLSEYTSDTNNPLYYVKSGDRGNTWGTKTLIRNNYDFALVNQKRIVKIGTRIWLPFAMHTTGTPVSLSNSGSQYTGRLIYTDNKGATWDTLSYIFRAPDSACFEPAFYQRPALLSQAYGYGLQYMVFTCRSRTGVLFYWFSDDNGVTWTGPLDGMKMPNSPYAQEFDSKNEMLISIFNRPNSSSAAEDPTRKMMVIGLSRDNLPERTTSMVALVGRLDTGYAYTQPTLAIDSARGLLYAFPSELNRQTVGTKLYMQVFDFQTLNRGVLDPYPTLTSLTLTGGYGLPQGQPGVLRITANNSATNPDGIFIGQIFSEYSSQWWPSIWFKPPSALGAKGGYLKATITDALSDKYSTGFFFDIHSRTPGTIANANLFTIANFDDVKFNIDRLGRLYTGAIDSSAASPDSSYIFRDPISGNWKKARLPSLSGGGGGGGSISLAAVGSTPNANGATLTGTVLNLEPASSSFPGVITTGTQSFAGAKTFINNMFLSTASDPFLRISNTSITNGDVDIKYKDNGAGDYSVLFNDYGNAHYVFNVASVEKFKMTKQGQFLIGGVSNPDGAALKVGGVGFAEFTGTGDAAHSNNVYLRVSNTNCTNCDMDFRMDVASDAHIINYAAGGLGFWTNNIQRSYITSAGKFGIGTLSPDSLMHVNGGLHVSGGIRVDNMASGVGTKSVRYNPANGQITYVDTSSGGGGLSMGTINSQTKAANGAVITGGTLVMQTADATHVGLMTASQWNTVDSVQKGLYPGDTLYYNRYTVGTGLSPAFLRNDTFNVKDLLFTNGLTPVQNADSTITIKDGGTLTENTTKTLSTLNYTFSQNSTGRLKLSGLKQDPYLTVLGHAADSSVVQLTAASLLSTLGITTGTYTPTLTPVTSIGSSTAHLCYYYQVGDNVTVYGIVEIDPTSAGAIELGVSLPIANDFTDALQVGGGAHSGDFAQSLGAYSDATNNRVSLKGITSSASNATYSFQFSYIINHL